MGADFNFPYLISQDTPAVAIEVQGNLDSMLAWVKSNYRQIDDTPNMTVRMVVPSDGGATNPNHVVTLSEVDNAIPTGTIWMWGGSVVPDVTKWQMCDGTSRPNTDPLFAVIGYQYGNPGGNSYNVPDMRAKFARGGTDSDTDRGAVGGDDDGVADHLHNMTHVHNLGGHTHNPGTLAVDIDHDHPDAPVTASTRYNVVDSTPNVWSPGGSATTGYATVTAADLVAEIPNYNVANRSVVGATTGPTTATDTGAANPDDTSSTGDVSEGNVPAYVTVNYMIRL